MLAAFKNHLQQHFPQLYGAKFLVAISGGVDSVVLAHLCYESGLSFALAHCNFHLRQEESEGDEEFVLKLGEALGAEVYVEHFDTLEFAKEHRLSVQMAARELRYHWFEDLRESLSYEFVLTAHHANDNLETFFINLIRGTGLNGLSGIPRRKDSVLRPLLPFSRQEIEAFAASQGIRWREDSSNASQKYMRNKIRHQLIPLLEELNPLFLEGFQKTQAYLYQSAELVEDYTAAIFPKVAKETPYGYSFDISLLKSLPHLRAVLYELFHGFGFTEWEDVYHLLDAQSGKMVLSETHRLIKDREVLLLTPIDEVEEYSIEVPEGERLVRLPMGSLHINRVEKFEKADKNTIFIDRKKLEFPLQLRKWREGDYFHPFGMQGTKKLSKFLKDEKLSLPEKENTWVLWSGDRILWVIGRRADARFQVDQTTEELLKITYVL